MPAADENAAAPGIVTPAPTTAPAGVSAGASRSSEKQYEFKASENKIIGELASKMHFVGLFLLAMGVLIIAIGVYPMRHYGPIMTGTLSCLVGLWTQRASVSFKNVVYTEGHDISHLIAALEDLRKLYSLQFWLLILALVLEVAGMLAIWFEFVDLSAVA